MVTLPGRALLVDGRIQRHDLGHPRLDLRQLAGRKGRGPPPQ